MHIVRSILLLMTGAASGPAAEPPLAGRFRNNSPGTAMVRTAVICLTSTP
jgi:hypothetical protein